MAAAALFGCVAGCSTGTDELDSSTVSYLGTVGPTAIVGELAFGRSVSVAYTSTPRYRAVSFVAQDGVEVDAWVRSADGDAVAWITDADFKSIAASDDAAPGTHDAHVKVSIARGGRYYIVFRERDYERATLTVSLDQGDPVPGAACAVIDQVVSRACGMCGRKSILCEKTPSGALAWSAYSPCEGEAGECTPGTQREEACDNCGTRSVSCTSTCRWATSACSAPPAATCTPGSVDLTSAGCAQPFTYRARQCDAACSYEPYGACEAAPTTIEVGPTPGSRSSTIVVLDEKIAVASGSTCPLTSSLAGDDTVSAYTQLHNPSAKAVRVSLFHSVAPQSAGPFATSIVVYDQATAPTTIAERRDCLKASNIGNATLTGNPLFASIDSSAKQFTIPAGATYVVYSAAESATVPSSAVKLTVVTETVAP